MTQDIAIPSPGRADRRGWLICMTIMVIALIAYWPVCRAEFVSWDDEGTVLQNEAMEHPSWGKLWERWKEPYLAMYMPITQTYYQAARVVGVRETPEGNEELNPTVFHVGMVLIALGNIPLIFFFLRRLVGNDWAAGAGCAVMMLHPMNDEAIAWVSEVSMPLCALFLVGCLLLWLRFRERAERKFYFWAVWLYLLALLTKPTCVCIPFMAAALDFFLLGVDWKKTAKQLAPWLVPAVLMAWYQGQLQSTQHYPVYVPRVWQRPLVALDAVVFYVGKLLYPVHLGIDYGRTPDWVLAQPRMLMCEAAAMLVLVVGIWKLRGLRRYVLCGVAFFLIGMGPVLGLKPFWFQVFSTVSDRYVFVPLLGVAIIVAAGLAQVRNGLVWMVITAVILICARVSFHQELYWHDSAALYMHEIHVHPHGWMGWDNTAYMLIGEQRWAEGMTLAEVAYGLDSTQTDIYSNIGMVLAANSNPRGAIPYFRRVIYAKEKDPITAMNLGAAYVQMRQYDLGIKWLRYAKALNPSSKKVDWLLRGAMELRKKQLSTRPSTRP